MPNLYIWFETKTERREFTEKLISLSLTGYNVSRGELGLYYETLKQSLNQMENGKTKGPYYMLYKKFYLGKIPEARYYNRYSAAEVFRRGFRNMYYQQSYCYRPGNWLVVRARDTIQGGKTEKWIYENTNKEQIGFNVPICRESVLRGYLRKAKELIRIYEKLDKQEIKYLINSLWYLNKVYDENKELFKNKNVYLWEKLAFYFYNEDDIKNSEFCLRKQASLQNGIADAYLNLGAFLLGKGYVKEALSSYLEGLSVNPSDEYILYNISSLMYEKENYVEVLNYLKNLIRLNPDNLVYYRVKRFLFA